MARQSRAPSLLVTRPNPQGQRFAKQLRARFAAVEIVQSPLMQTRFLPVSLPKGPFQAVLFTSETGVRAVEAWQAALPRLALCVGNRTAKVAADMGFETLSADGDASALIALAARRFSSGRLLHLRGQDSAGDIAETLTKGGLETVSCIVYAQEPCPPTPAALALLAKDDPVLLPLFSPRSARLLADALPIPPRAPIWIVALSPAVATAAEALRPAGIFTAAHPTGESMLHAVAEALSLPFNA